MSRINSRAEMEAFVRSAERGGFTPAARELGLTPSALSKFVSRLERRLGVPLLHRTTRKLTPTPEGARLLAGLRRVLDELESVESEVAASDTPRGRLQMIVGVGFGGRLVPVLPEFRERHPQVQVDLRIEDRIADLVAEGLDLAVSILPLHDGALAARKLCDVDRFICASPAYLARHGVPKTPEDLLAHSCITLQGVAAAARWPFARGRKLIRVRGDITVNNAEAMLRLALAGAGIARLNEIVCGEAIREGRLVAILRAAYDGERTALTASFPEGRDKVPRVRAMLDFMEEKFAQPPWRDSRPEPRTRLGRHRAR